MRQSKCKISPQTSTRFGRFPFHEPTPLPLPGGEQTFISAAKVPLLGGVKGGFMVPMHARGRKEAFHEPGRPGRLKRPSENRYNSDQSFDMNCTTPPVGSAG